MVKQYVIGRGKRAHTITVCAKFEDGKPFGDWDKSPVCEFDNPEHSERLKRGGVRRVEAIGYKHVPNAAAV